MRFVFLQISIAPDTESVAMERDESNNAANSELCSEQANMMDQKLIHLRPYCTAIDHALFRPS